MELVTLWGECGDFAIPERLWRALLGVGQRYGWEPAGTLPPLQDIDADEPSHLTPWDGTYYPGDLQRMTEADAQALATAVESALADIPDVDVVSRSCGCGEDCWRLYCARCAATAIRNAMAELSGNTKTTLRELISHLREPGGVWIA